MTPDQREAYSQLVRLLEHAAAEGVSDERRYDVICTALDIAADQQGKARSVA